MLVWRLTKSRYADLSGQGGEITAGRWHSKGRRILYSALNASLAVLEARVHLSLSAAPDDYVLMRIEVPNEVDVRVVEAHGLPADWRDRQSVTRAVGDAWLVERRSALLIVPSAIIDIEQNVLVNPRHSDASRLRISDIRSFTWDGRLLEAPPVK